MRASASSAATPPPPPSAVAPPGSPDTRALLNLALAAVVIAGLFVARDVLIPIILAVMLSFVLWPLVTALGRAGLPRAPSVLVAVLMTFGLVVLAAALLASQVSTLAADAPRYADAIQQKLQALERRTTSEVALVSGWFTRTQAAAPAPVAVAVPPPSLAARPPDAAALAAAATAARGRPVLVELAQRETSPVTVVRTILEPVLAPVETTVIVLVIAIFILMQREDLRDRFIRLAGSDDLHRTTAAMDDAGERLSRFFLSQVAVNGTFGIVIGVGLWGLGIPSPALWGVLAGLLRFVPYIGPIIAAVPPLALAAAVEPGWYRVAEAGVLFLVVEPLTGYVVEPLLYGHSTGLAPISVIVAAVFWTWMWGPIGLILSTPLTLCLVVVGRHVESLEFLDVLLGDRPALAPVETLYQRLLADNPDEVLEKAEALLSDRTLLDYYESVMLPALKLAVADEARGMISRARAAQMAHSLLQVIGDLRDHQDVERPVRPQGASSTDSPERLRVAASTRVVACVAGRGAFDDAVSAMLCQVLERAGLPTRAVRHADVSRDNIAQLDLTDVAVVVLSYLDMDGASAHLRYLVKRLRHHAPDAAIVVGLWPGAEATTDADAREAIGADAYVGTLAEAQTRILERLRTDVSGPMPH